MGRSGFLAFALLFAGAMVWPKPSGAEGAVAIGLPANVAKSGVALGYSTKHPTRERAEEVALEQCRTAPASKAVQSLCRIVQTFTDQCVAFAIDPATGTPGYGWAVADDKEAASDAALQMCVEKSNPSRRKFCKVTSATCDQRAD
jgi:hypothetical protein